MNPSPTVVFVHAHPDDEAIFTGVTIRRAVDSGARVVVISSTGGEAIFTGVTIRRAVDSGARVVVISSTGGEAGECRLPLADGESLDRRRRVELERACELLGVARLVMLGYRDSGAHRGPYAPGTLGAAPTSEVADRIAAVVREENATALVSYDQRGITGHVDHLQVHRASRQVVADTGIVGYETTLDRAALRRGSYRIAQAATDDPHRMGTLSRSVSLTVSATVPELLAKMAAMAVHGSQITPNWLDSSTFGHGYGHEWFVRRGRRGILDELATTERVLVNA